MKTSYRFFSYAHWSAACCLVVWLAPGLHGQPPRIDPAGVRGALLLCGKGDVSPAALERFIDLAGGDKAKIVVLAVDGDKLTASFIETLAAACKKKGAAEPRLANVGDVKGALRDATGVWLMLDSAKAWQDELKKPGIADACQTVLKRGGAIGTSGAGAELIAAPGPLTLLPGAAIETRSPAQARSKLPDRLKAMPGIVGYQIDPGAAMIVKGRTISAVGDRRVAIYVPGNPSLREIILQDMRVEDLTALRRNARDRAEGFPPKVVDAPVVEKGTLVIVGGGGSPAGLQKKFVEYAGGAGKAVIVIFPTAAADPLPKRESVVAAFMKAGAKKATVLYAQKQKDVESKEFLDALKEATGLWFDGGRQWRFVDCYESTKALPLMHDVLRRGGVIGGTSAGATIQGDYFARGGVFNNFDIRYPGYERGLGFLKGVAIDQHFTQRKRQKDMTQLMKVYPQYLGIGIDESTAIVVKGSVAEVIGKGKAHFYDANRKVEKGQPDYEALSASGRYDLKGRKVLAGAE